jgi:probable rRNA maturation factor
MTFNIEIQNEDDYPVNVQRLQKAVVTVLSNHKVEHAASLTIVITTNEAVTELNHQYRGVNAPTDILSFPADALPEEIQEAPYLGDLVIAYPYAAAQAQNEKHNLDDSLDLLVIHGTLHLLGYDHDTQENRAEMWAVQNDILTALGIPTDIVPALESQPHDE